ncbi:LAETG motif-containing sortase-dependent surface protein [Streptomyces inhibens]|uniref:LAETG motif-containing sortase-dependent surface protein n=1 Tax=Streptomyces inhibens TaxID=2293571 RepID=UPI0037B47E09
MEAWGAGALEQAGDGEVLDAQADRAEEDRLLTGRERAGAGEEFGQVAAELLGGPQTSLRGEDHFPRRRGDGGPVVAVDDVSELAVTVPWYNPATGKWKPIEGDGAKFQNSDDFTTVKRLEPGEHADARMRIKIDKKAKAGSGYFFTIGHSYGEDGTCGFDKISQFDFKVLSAGSKPGKVEDAKGKPGKPGKPGEQGTPNRPGTPGGTGGAGNKPAAHGTHDAVPGTGKLATTGSSSALPTVAAIGGAAVVAGAGAVFVVRRRRAGSGA